MLDAINKLTSSAGANFIIFLHEAFTHVNPKSAKDTDDLTVFFLLLETWRIKTSRKHFGEIDPRSDCHCLGDNRES